MDRLRFRWKEINEEIEKKREILGTGKLIEKALFVLTIKTTNFLGTSSKHA